MKQKRGHFSREKKLHVVVVGDDDFGLGVGALTQRIVALWWRDC